MFYLRTVICSALLFTAAASSATDNLCVGSLARPDFNFKQEMANLDKAAFAIGARWTDDREWAAEPVSNRLKLREDEIEKVYTELRSRRKAAYLGASCKVANTKKCASTPGRRKVCPISVDAPENTLFARESLTAIGSSFEVRPKISSDGRLVSYAMKKTGRGSNTGGFSALAKFNPDVVDSWVEREVERAQDYMRPLLRAQMNMHSGRIEVTSSQDPSLK